MAYDTRLLRREQVAEGTTAFWFERPAGFQYQAGQNATFSLVEPGESDAFGPSRTFSFASAPHEPELMVATRMRDTAFKRTLATVPLGTRVRVDEPGGLMVLGEADARPTVFLAGGIGITPFLSMARHAAHARLPHKIHLFYSNRRPEDAPFLAELGQLAQVNPNFRLIPTMTQMPKSRQAWQGATGPIGPALLGAHLPDPRKAVYYFAGPTNMAMSMHAMLEALGVAADDMLSEEFYGY